MKRALVALAGGAFLLSAGCPVQDMAGLPEWTAYGKLKADFAIDSEETSTETGAATGEYVAWVYDNADDGNFIMGVRDSRFGAKMGDPEMDPLTARVEVDFHDNDFLMRHVYVRLDLGGDASLIAGQTTDVFAPLMPDTLNWPVGWWAGNVGHRSPQIRWEFDLGGGTNVQAAISDPQDNNVSMPDIQARIGWKQGEESGAGFGVSVVIGNTDRDDDDVEEDLSGVAVDFEIRASDTFGLTGEWYVGKNLAGYMGNIGETAAWFSDATIGGTGLWVQAKVKLSDAVTLNGGFMFDDNDEADLANNDREANSCIFVNLINQLNDETAIGIEISKWETEYWNAGPGTTTPYDNLRIQGSLIVKF